MSEPEPTPHVSAIPQQLTDASHLRTLAICHYVLGGLTIAFSSLFIIHIVLGTLMVSGAMPLNAPPTTAPAGMPAPAQQPLPNWFGYMFIGVGTVLVLLGWTTGVLTILSGRWIARQRRHVFSLVVAGIQCVNVPLGTVLGVFTFVVLLRPSVRGLYDANR